MAQSLAGAGNFSAPVNTPATSSVQPAFYSMGLSGSFVVGKAGGGEFDSYIQYSAEINKWSCTSTGHCLDEVHRDVFAVPMCMLGRQRTLQLYTNSYNKSQQDAHFLIFIC